MIEDDFERTYKEYILIFNITHSLAFSINDLKYTVAQSNSNRDAEELKVIVVGNGEVGKTSMIRRFCT